jgi:hypothetical protein
MSLFFRCAVRVKLHHHHHHHHHQFEAIPKTDVDTARATAELTEREVIEEVVEVDDNTFEVETN